MIVNFVRPLGWAEECQRGGKILFLGMSVRVFLEEIRI